MLRCRRSPSEASGVDVGCCRNRFQELIARFWHGNLCVLQHLLVVVEHHPVGHHQHAVVFAVVEHLVVHPRVCRLDVGLREVLVERRQPSLAREREEVA